MPLASFWLMCWLMFWFKAWGRLSFPLRCLGLSWWSGGACIPTVPRRGVPALNHPQWPWTMLGMGRCPGTHPWGAPATHLPTQCHSRRSRLPAALMKVGLLFRKHREVHWTCCLMWPCFWGETQQTTCLSFYSDSLAAEAHSDVNSSQLPVRRGNFLQPSHVSMELRSRVSSKIRPPRPECPICGKVGSCGSVLQTHREPVFVFAPHSSRPVNTRGWVGKGQLAVNLFPSCLRRRFPVWQVWRLTCAVVMETQLCYQRTSDLTRGAGERSASHSGGHGLCIWYTHTCTHTHKRLCFWLF